MTIDAGDLSLVHQGDHATDQLAIGIFGMAGGKFEPGAPVLMNLSLNDEQFAAALKQGIPFVHDMNIARGIEKVRVVVMDMSASRLGSLTVPVE